MNQLVPAKHHNNTGFLICPYLLCDFPCDFLSLLAEVLDDVFEGVDFDSAAPPFFCP